MILEAAKDVLLDGQVLWTKGERRETDDPEEIAKLRSQGFVDAGTIEPGVREAVDSVFREGLDFSDPTGQHSTPVYVAKAAVQGAASSLAHGVAGLEKGAVGGVLDLASAGERVLGNGAAADQLQDLKRGNEALVDRGTRAVDDFVLGDAFDNSREAWEKVMGVSEGLGGIYGGIKAAAPLAAGLKGAKLAKTAEGAMKAAFTAQMAAGGEEAARTAILTKKDEHGNPVVDENGQPVIENRDLTWRERAEVAYHTAKEAITAQFFGRLVGAWGGKIGNAGAAALEFGGINAAGVLADAYIGDNIAGREWKDEDGNVLVGSEKGMAVLQKMGAEFLYGGMQSLLMSMGGAIAGTEKRLAANRRKAVKDAMERPKVVAVGANGERVLEGGALVRVAEDGTPEVVTPYGVVLDAEGKVKTVTAGNVGETGEGAYGTDVKVRVNPLTGRPTAARETVRNALIALQEGVTIDQLRESDGWTPENKAVFETVARLKQGLAEGMPAGELVDALAGLGIGERDARAFGFIPEGSRYVGDALAVANNGTRSLQNAVGNGGPGHIPLDIAAEVARSVNAGTTGLMPKELAKRQLETARQLMAERAKAKVEESAAEHGNTPETERAVLDTPVEKEDGTLQPLGRLEANSEEGIVNSSKPGSSEGNSSLSTIHSSLPGTAGIRPAPSGEPGVYVHGAVPEARVETGAEIDMPDGTRVKGVLIKGLDPAEMLRPERRDAIADFLIEVIDGAQGRVAFENPEAEAAARELLKERVAREETQAQRQAEQEIVDAGQNLVDGLFGKESGIKVRRGTPEEAMGAAEGAVGKNASVELLKDTAGEICGYWDRAKKEVVLFGGASAETLGHEIAWHAVRQWAETNSPELLAKMNEYAKRCPEELRKLIEKAYKDFSGDALLDEIGAGRFENELGGRFRELLGRNAEARTWWEGVKATLKEMWQAFVKMIDGGAIDLSRLDKMDADEGMRWLVDQMLQGRRLEGGGKGVMGAEPGDKRLSLAGRRTDGIEVYESDPAVLKMPYRKRKKQFRDVMVRQYAGRTARFTRNGQTYYATFEKGDVRKNIHGDAKSDREGLGAKINAGASGDMFDLVENARYDHTSQETGKKIRSHSGVKSWDYFDKTVQIDNKVFDVVINVRDKGNDQFVYNVQLNRNRNIKPVRHMTPSPQSGTVLKSGATGSTPQSIPQNGGGAQAQIRPSIGGIYTGTAADYANRSRQGGKDDGPSLKKIGTGEGSQVYGWGLYGSNVRGVAEGYAGRDRRTKYTFDGKPIADAVRYGHDFMLDGKVLTGKAKLRAFVAETLSEQGGKENAIRYLTTETQLPMRKSAIAEIEKNGERYGNGSGNLYEQTFFTDRAPGDESHLLKWYEPVSEEQRKWIADELVKEGWQRTRDTVRTVYGQEYDPYHKGENEKDYENKIHLFKGAKASELYRDLSELLGTPQAASEFLARAGIDGVKYPVDSYGGKGVKNGDEVGWNYVSFRDDNIRVDHKWTDGQLRFSRGGVPVSKLSEKGKNQRYYEVPFDKAVDKIVANRRAGGRNAKLISDDYVFVGETPSALEEIGFVKLPVMMTQHHIETCYFTKRDGVNWNIGGHMHGLGDILKKVPDALKKPVMVIASRSKKGKDTSVVAITSVSTPEGDMILPIVINGEPEINSGKITAHVMTSAHGRRNAWTGLVKEAIEAEGKGDIGVFYMDNAKTSKVFTSLAKANPQLASLGLKYAKRKQVNGLVHSIHDPGSPVKAQAAKISSQTETRQFKEFFGDVKKDPANASKVVDANGEPLVVYHETGNDFTVFDPRHEGAGGRDYETPFGIFLKPSSTPLGVARGGKTKQMALYANIRNPMQFANRKELDQYLRANCEGYAQAADAIKNIDTEYKKRLEAAEKVEDEAMMDIYRNHPEVWNDDAKRMEAVEKYSAETKRILEEWKGAADKQSADLKEITDQFFRSSGHDGIVLESDEGSFGRKTKTYIAFSPEQVKSATDNIGTFDPGNPDIRFSRGGYKPGDWRKTFTFGKAARGAAEQTNGGLAAGEERRRWEENPVDERIPEWDAPARNPNVAKPFALSSAEGVRLVKLLGGTMKKPKAYKDAIGVIDESDEQRIREDLKAMGFFKGDDYLWAATSDPATVAADRADSQAALDARLEKLGEQRLKGEAGGGNRGLVRVSMSQVADLVLSLPAETGGNLGNVRTLAQGIVRGFERDRTPEQAAYFLQEAQGLLDWFYGRPAEQPKPQTTQPQNHQTTQPRIEPRQLLARAFGAFLEAPDAVAERAPGLYREFVDAISRNDKLLHAFDAIRRTALGEGSAERVYAEIEAGRTARAEEAARRLADEVEKPIGSRLERAKDSFVYNFDDMHGPIFMHITRAQKRQLAELKASLKAGRITQADYDAATAAFRQAVQGLKIAELKVDRGTQNEIRQYLWDMSFVFEQAKAAGVDPKDAQRYMDLRWIVSTGGRAGARGMSARDAQIVLDNMKRNMGDEAFARLEGVSAQFHAVREKNILDDPRLAAMIGQDRVDYFKNNVHYVRTERTRATPEELAKMEADRAAFRRENKGDDDVTAAMLSLLDKTGGRGGGIGNSTWGHALEGSVKDVKDRLAATWRNDTRLMAAMERNDFVIRMRDALLAAKAEGVHDLPGSRGVDYPQNARYGHIRYFENGKMRVLVVPRVLADGYRQVSDAMTGWSAWGKIAHGVFIDWNLAYTLRNMTRNMASNEANIVGMRADNATILGNAIAPGAGRAASMAAYQIARHLPSAAIRNRFVRTVWGEHVNAAYAGQAQRILELYLDPRKALERRAAAEEARLRGVTGPAMELDADLELMRFMTKSGALIARWDEVHGAGRDADLFMRKSGLGEIYAEKGPSAPKSRAHKILAGAGNVLSYPFRRNAQFNRDLELHAKITAALAIHEMQPGLTAEQVGIEVARRASIPWGERQGRMSRFINYAWNMFFNTALKGGQRFVGNMVRNPRLAGKMVAQSLGPQLFWATMIAGGGLAAVIRNMFGGGDDAEEKARQAGLGWLLKYVQLMHDGSFAASPYLQRFYHWCPLGQVGKRYIGIALPRTDEEKMLLPFIDWAAAKFAPQPTDPTATLGDAVGRGVVGTFVPDIFARTPLVAAAQDLVFAWWQNPMDTYRGTHVYDNSLWQARGESVADAAAFAWATAKQGFNDLGGRTIVRPRRNKIEVAEGSGAQPPSFAEKAWDFALNDIPVLSGVLGGTLRMTLTKEQRLDQVEREVLAPIRAVKNRRSEEIMKMMLESPVANNGSETPEIKEKLDAWAKKYEWDEAERGNVFARALNGYQAATKAGQELAAQRKEANRQKRWAARPASERRAMEAAGLAVIQSE